MYRGRRPLFALVLSLLMTDFTRIGSSDTLLFLLVVGFLWITGCATKTATLKAEVQALLKQTMEEVHVETTRLDTEMTQIRAEIKQLISEVERPSQRSEAWEKRSDNSGQRSSLSNLMSAKMIPPSWTWRCASIRSIGALLGAKAHPYKVRHRLWHHQKRVPPWSVAHRRRSAAPLRAVRRQAPSNKG